MVNIPINITLVSGAPADGKEFEYSLAWKHRHGWAELYKRTPWWQFKKKNKRFDEWMRAIRRCHIFGKDVHFTY